MRVAALRAMGRNASDDWLQVLVFNFDDDDAEIRAVAATAAGQLLLEEAVPPLQALIDDTDEDVQVAAIAALGEIGDDEAERILTRLVEESSEPHIADAARDALAEVQLLAMDLDQGRETLGFDEESTMDAGNGR
jgi:HEAT repeat protein